MQPINAQPLDPAFLPLAGRHLIEASAGTGKTYNITRLYLRCLLEKDLSVQQILVMTFTKAATEELRGRIDNELRNALENWGELGQQDPFFAVMEKRLDKAQALMRLKPALLSLDEAAIYTIHGFCKRVLTTESFASGMPLEMTMEADSSQILLECVRDWLRRINQNTDDFNLLFAKSWHTPEYFLATFFRALTSSTPLESPKSEQLQASFNDFLAHHMQQRFIEKKDILALLQEQAPLVLSELVDNKSDAKNRKKEWQSLLMWLQTSDASSCPKSANDFVNGNRYRKNPQFKILFGSFKKLRDAHKKEREKQIKRLETQIQDVPVYQLVVQGISQIRENFSKQKKKLALMDFDDLITKLSKQLSDNKNTSLIKQLRQSYPVALVDEFQDTDNHQYAILDTLYPQGDKTLALMMIGDPKQAIYSFRGGDIFTYLAARHAADYHWVMQTNWRSVKGMIHAYNRLFWGQPLTENKAVDVFGFDIGYQPIQATEKSAAAQKLLADPNTQRAAMNYLWLPEVINPSGRYGKAKSEDWQNALVAFCVGEISRLLQDVKLAEHALQEKDIAILVRRGSEAYLLKNALSQAGYASVYLSDKENIYHSLQANELQLVLKGILACENDTLLTAACSTYLMGGDAQQLAKFREAGDDSSWEKQRERAIELRQLWIEKGCMTMLLHLIRDSYQPEPEQHERALTNIIHLAELLQQASRQHKHPQQLLKWFQDQCQEVSTQETSQLRLESDAKLIRIVTLHGCKGLEYPIVFIPFVSHYRDPVRHQQTLHEYFEYHHPKSKAPIHLVGQSNEAITLSRKEGHAESIRLLYVAVTRATHRCYMGIAPFQNSHLSPLGLTLKLSQPTWQETLSEIVENPNNHSILLTITSNNKGQSKKQPSHDTPLNAAKFQQTIDDSWTLSSFTALVRNAHVVRQEQKERNDIGEIKRDESQQLRFTLRKGAAAGNLLHDILEHMDFSKPSTTWRMDAPLRRYGELDEDQQQALITWLDECVQALIPVIGNKDEAFSLSALKWSQTLRESEFYFPMDNVSLNAISKILQWHRNTDESIELPGKKQLAGMMHGFIDLIFEYQGRYYVADYKSTYLGNQCKDYQHAYLLQNNQRHFYDLQYLIYSLALHRYLNTRITHYDPTLHFGGVYYLYLRGMNTQYFAETYYGIFCSDIDISLLDELDYLFQSESA